MQRSRAFRAFAFVAAAAWAAPANAHAGGVEAAPIVGGAAGFIAGVVIGSIPSTWRKFALLVAFGLLLSPIVYLVYQEPDFPSNIGAATASWLALGFAFFITPAGLLGFVGYALTSWGKRAVQYHRRHGRHAEEKSG
jgi:hypothetical protein